ncbi:MAG: ribosomal RNA small subunit methyltransferase A [Treponema sp.]|nr:ribosomal RNA small subunit methyltransferase A [Treponema sp.]
MDCPDYNSPQALKKILDEKGFAMQKRFGQNFLTSPDARDKIVSLLSVVPGEDVWEVGPGLGAMSGLLLEKGARLTAFELDRGFISLLERYFAQESGDGSFRIVAGDVLKNWKGELSRCGKDSSCIKLFGNLPYNIAATFIADTVTGGSCFTRCVFTVQREVADRMRARPGSKDNSSFSILCQWFYDVKACVDLAPGCFWPRPNVASQAVLFTPRKKSVQVQDKRTFVNLVHALFSQRRKTLLNNIKPLLPPGVDAEFLFERAGVSKGERAENLCVEEFASLADALFSVRP